MRHAAIALLLLVAAISGSDAQETVVAPRDPVIPGTPVVSAPLTHENLSLYILEDPDAKSFENFITLEEGIKTGQVRVWEKSQAQVDELLVQNSSKQPCFVQAGDVVKGGQQDRAIATDLVLPPRSGKVPVRSFCVERGRWAGGGGVFGRTTGLVAGARLRTAIQKDKNQDKVWEAVEEAKKNLVQANALSESKSTSLNEQMLDRKIQARLAGFMKTLGKACDKKDRAVGLVTAVNGKLSTADVYADPGLFRKLYPRLLASAALEAMSAPPREASAPLSIDVSKFLSKADQGKASGDVREGKGTLQFRAKYGSVELHRQSLVQ